MGIGKSPRTSEAVTGIGVDMLIVMIPTAPLPFGGAIMCVPADWVRPMDCGIDGLLNIYMSMGVTMPQFLPADSDSGTNEGQRGTA